MTDRKDLKKLVRARMAETGESYTTALRHVSSGGRFRAIVEKTIRLAAAWREEEHRLYPPDRGIISGGELARRMRERLSGAVPRPAFHAYMEHLEGLDRGDIVALVTLHYVGRNGDPAADTVEYAFTTQRAYVSREESRVTGLNKLIERTSMDRDLVSGLKLAAKIGLDIEELSRTT
ncbi:hypothetical protein NR798_19335 [Archangium gephyra]|uniref:hypothetical protein n=1 Tax=Archangium gephyra TaxID=48 RepID=UPI0035D46E08